MQFHQHSTREPAQKPEAQCFPSGSSGSSGMSGESRPAPASFLEICQKLPEFIDFLFKVFPEFLSEILAVTENKLMKGFLPALTKKCRSRLFQVSN
jgi:hypothetical protein